MEDALRKRTRRFMFERARANVPAGDASRGVDRPGRTSSAAGARALVAVCAGSGARADSIRSSGVEPPRRATAKRRRPRSSSSDVAAARGLSLPRGVGGDGRAGGRWREPSPRRASAAVRRILDDGSCPRFRETGRKKNTSSIRFEPTARARGRCSPRGRVWWWRGVASPCRRMFAGRSADVLAAGRRVARGGGGATATNGARGEYVVEAW